MTKCIKVNENNIETILVDPFSYTNDIYNKLNIDYDFRFKFKDKYIYAGKFIFEYNLKNNDNIELINDKSNKIKLTVRLPRERKTIIVYPNDPVYVIYDVLNLSEKRTKFIYAGITYDASFDFAFEEIGIKRDTYISLFNQAIAG